MRHEMWNKDRDRQTKIAWRLFASGDLLHAIKSAASLEPGDLEVVEAVIQLYFLGFAIGVLDFSGQLLAGCEAV